MALRVVSPYKAGSLSYEVGQVITNLVPEEEARLLRDSPGSFEVIAPEVPPAAEPAPKIQEPVADKMLRTPAKKKEA